MDRVRRVSVLVSLGSLLAMVLVGGASLALAAVINGDAGDDRLIGTAKRDIIRGFAGDDRLSGSGGPDELHGNTDRDFVTGNAGNDEVYGNRGDDSGTSLQLGIEGGGLFGGPGNDAIYGRSGKDLLYDTQGEDVMKGGRGADAIEATDFSRDRDRIICGSGRDIVFADRNDRIADDCERVILDSIP